MPVIQGLKLLVCWCECKDQYHCHRSQLPQTLFNEACMEPTFEAIFSNLNTMSFNEMVYKLFSSESNGGKFSKIYALLWQFKYNGNCFYKDGLPWTLRPSGGKLEWP